MDYQIGAAEAQLARSIFQEFRAKPGSQFIASDFTLSRLAEKNLAGVDRSGRWLVRGIEQLSG